MADKKVFTLTIDGVKQSYDEVAKLYDILNKITDVNAKVSISTDKVSKSSSESTSKTRENTKALTDEEKVQKRLDDLQVKINYSKTQSAKREAELREELRQSNLTLKQTIRTNEAAEGSIEQQRSELAKLRNEYVRLSKEVRESDIGKNMKAEIDSLVASTQKANKSIGVTSDRVGSYEDAITSALGINGEFAKSILGMSKGESGASSLSSFFTTAGTSAKAFGKTLLGLLSNPVFLAIAGIAGAGMAVKFWYDYNKGLEEATRLTKQFTDLAGNELKAYRNEVQGVADTFGKDFKDVLESTNAVAKQFGISQQEALKYVKDGFVAGADANGDFLNILKEYPAYFKEAGTSADEFIAITSETANSGIFSDKGIDAIKEANIRLREMTKATSDALDGIGISSDQVQKDLQSGATTTFEVMQKVSDKLNEYPEQSKQVGTAIADIFGGPGEDAGLQYLKTLKDIDTNLDEVKKNTGQLGEIQEKQMNANIELQNAVSALFDQTGGTFETMIGNAKVFATESLTGIIKGSVDIVNWFIEIYNKNALIRQGVTALITTFKLLFEGAKAAIEGITLGFEALGGVIKGVLTGNFDALDGLTQKLQDNLKKSWENVKKIAKDATNEITSGKTNPIEIPVNVVTNSKATNNNKDKDKDNNSGGNNSNRDKEREEALKYQQQLDEMLRAEHLKAIKDDEAREIISIRQQYEERRETIKGESEKEKQVLSQLAENEESEIGKIRKKYQEQRDKEEKDNNKKKLDEQKALLDISLKDTENFYGDIKELEETVRDKNGIIDVEATRSNLAEANVQLTQYLSILEFSKKEIEAYYDGLLEFYSKDSIEYKKALQEKEDALKKLENQVKDTNKEITDNTQSSTNAQRTKWDEEWGKIADSTQKYTNAIMQGLDSIFNAIGSLFQSQLDDANDKLDAISEKYDEVVERREESDARLEELEEKAKDARGGRYLILQEQINAEMATNQQLASQEKQLAKEKEKQEQEIAKKEKQQKRVELAQNIVQAIANVAMGATKALAEYGPILGVILAAVLSAAGAVQVGIMTAQLAKLEDGGLLKGKRHSQGGMRVEGTNIEVEGGEYVVNRESTDKNIGLIKYINSQRRTLGANDLSSFFSKSSQGFEPPFKRMFETGGQLPASINTSGIDYSLMASAMKDSIQGVKIEPKVAVTDINQVQNDVVKVDNWSGM